MSNIKVGYLMFFSSTPGIFSGGLMVCDSKGFPVEFRYSEPISPTKLQQILYGNVLEKYVKLDVISESLLKSVSCNIDLMIVQDEMTLNHKFNKDFPVMRISPTKAQILDEVGKNLKIKDKEFLLQSGEKTSPVRVQFPPYKDISDADIATQLQLLTELGSTMEIEEPLNRVHRALELVCQQAQTPKQDVKA